MHYRLICVRRLEIVLQNFLEDPTLQLFMYGSCITGLSLPTSDIDLALQGFEIQTKVEVGNVLCYVLQHLQNFDWIKKIHCITSAHVPVLKIEIDPNVPFAQGTFYSNEYYYVKHMQNRLDLQLNVNEECETTIKMDVTMNSYYQDSKPHSGHESTKITQQYLFCYP